MNKFRYPDLVRFQPRINRLELHSYEMNVYLIKITLGDKSGMLYDDKERLMKFSSTQSVRDAFETIEVEQAEMLHYSPYDEMIGNPPSASEPMKVPFSLLQPY